MKIDNRVVIVGDKINFKLGTELEDEIIKINKDNFKVKKYGEIPFDRCYLGQGKTLTEKQERKSKLKNVLTAKVENGKVTIGDTVGFKCGEEQDGKIIDIKTVDNIVILVLEDQDGFSGGYIGGETKTEMEASRCWIIG
jgi:hypothetical protein